METAQRLRNRRVVARIPGHMVCTRAGISRGRLSEIELGRVHATDEELKRIDDALRLLIEARKRMARVAAQCGWPINSA